MAKITLNIEYFKKLVSNRLLRNAGWLGLAELANRFFRLGTTVTLARVFSHEDYGLMAIIYTTFELTHVFTFENGLKLKIIQANESHLTETCQTSYWLNWIFCSLTILLQCAIAVPFANMYGKPQLALPLCVLSAMHLLFPMFMVQSALIERENRLQISALCQGMQSLISNLITIFLALLGFGVWAIVLAMVLSTPVWIIITWRNHSWRPPKSINFENWKVLMRFSRNMSGVELLKQISDQIDYLIVGKVLGLEALGIYFFAFSAGSGITMNVVNSLILALYPHLCTFRETLQSLKEEYFNSLRRISKLLIPLVLLQSALAPFYVPIIFGSKWSESIPILILICLSVIPRAYKLTSTILLNTTDKTHLSLQFNLIYTSIFVLAIWLAAPYGVFWVAVTVLGFHSLMSCLFSWMANRLVFASLTSR